MSNHRSESQPLSRASLHELRINDPEALVTTSDRGQVGFQKSDQIEFGVNSFIELPEGFERAITVYTGAKMSGETKVTAIKKALAAFTAFLALVPSGLARSSSTETHTGWVAQTTTTTTKHTVEVPIDHTATVKPYEWDKTTRQPQQEKRATEKAVQEILDSVQEAEQHARDSVPAGSTVTEVESSVDVKTIGGADDSHDLSPDSNNKRLGRPDSYNDGQDGLAQQRGEQTHEKVVPALEQAGVDVDSSTTDGVEHILTPEQIQLGNEMAKRHGYNDFDELIQAIEHGRHKLKGLDKKLYDQMITSARRTTIEVNGEVVVTYQTTETRTTEVPVSKTETREQLVAIPGGLVAIALDEHPKRDDSYPKRNRGSTPRETTLTTPTPRPIPRTIRPLPTAYPDVTRRRLSKNARRGGVSGQRPGGGSPVRKVNGATSTGSRHPGAFLPNSR